MIDPIWYFLRFYCSFIFYVQMYSFFHIQSLEPRAQSLETRVYILESLECRIQSLESRVSRVSRVQNLESRVQSLESLESKVQSLYSLESRVQSLQSLQSRVQILESIVSRVQSPESSVKSQIEASVWQGLAKVWLSLVWPILTHLCTIFVLVD